MKRLYFIFFLLAGLDAFPQINQADSLSYRTVAANPTLQNRSASWQKAWGTNRRAEWGKEVTVPVLWLDKAGLTVYQGGGSGNETRSLRLRSKEGKEYSLRSVNKSREEVIEKRFKGTIVEDIINDQLSSSHPYGAFPLSIMQDKAGIYHPIPVLYYVPKQPALDSFNTEYGDELYTLEERPDEDWSNADHLGNFKSFSSTEKVLEKLAEDNDNQVDQFAFIKARLFDMLIADWDRHEDNYRWGKKKQGDETLYVPIPRDRDQAFYTHNGKLIDKMLPMAGLSFMQHFDYKFGNPVTLNKQERYFDRYFANEMDLNNWIAAANHLKTTLTDDVIGASVKQLPPEIFAISGNELIEKLRARREKIDSIAKVYYLFIAKEVDITGSEKKEIFEVKRNDSHVEVNIYRKKSKELFYQRKFHASETKEIRIHGIDGEDLYDLSGSSPIVIRLIGGPARDSFVNSGGQVHIYDNHHNSLNGANLRRHLSNDSAVHLFKYDNFQHDSKGISPTLGYEHEDRIFAGLEWSSKKHKWRRYPYASSSTIGVQYSFEQHNIRAYINLVYPSLIGKWDLLINGLYDGAVWRNFPGLGNETVWNELFDNYYQMRSKEWTASVGIRRKFGKNALELSGLFHQVDTKKDVGRHPALIAVGSDPKMFDENSYAGGKWKYTYANVNDDIVPTKGFSFLGHGMYMKNFSRDQFFQNYQARLQAWLPLSKKFSICVRAGGTTIVGKDTVLQNALFWQHAVTGGPELFRGYRRERFWGKTSFQNSNELRYITNIRTHLFAAKVGLIGFFDNGRVWMPNENSDKWHSSWGGGLLIAPFEFVSFTLSYGISEEMKLFQFRVNSIF